jgi:hypothetical protein
MLVVRAGLETYSMQYTLALSIGGICTVGRATGTGMKAAVSNSADRALRMCVHARSRSEEYQDCHHGVATRRWQDGVSKQSVSCFGQLSSRSRTEQSIACYANRKSRGLIFKPAADSRVLIVGDHASKLRLASCCHQQILSQKNGHADDGLVACLGDMEPCEPPSTHKSTK